MKKVIAIILLCWLGLSIGSQAQSVAIKIKPAPFIVRPVCPAPGHVWVNGYWGWNGRYHKNIWIDGYWTRVPRRSYYRRGHRF